MHPTPEQYAEQANHGLRPVSGREKLNVTPYFIGGKIKGYNIDAEEYARLSRNYGSLKSTFGD